MSQKKEAMASGVFSHITHIVLRYHAWIPTLLVAMMLVGVILYWDPTQKVIPHWRVVLGKDILIPYGNLLLLFYFLLVKALPLLVEHIQQRSLQIAEGVRSFEERNDVIVERYREIRGKLQSVDQEAAVILERAKKQALEEKEKLLKQALRQAQRIKADAENLVTQNLRLAQQSMQRKMLDQAFIQAQENILKHIQEGDHARLQTEYIKELRERS